MKEPSPLYSERLAIRNAIARCTNPNHRFYPDYGGRGIAVCQEWMEDQSRFLVDMGHKPSPQHQLDRIDNDKGYYKENCRWVPPGANNRNKRNTIWVEYEGEVIRLREASVRSGIHYRTLFDRWAVGCTGEHLFRPISHSSKQHLKFITTPTRYPT